MHLLKSKELNKPTAKFPVGGSNKVVMARYEESKQNGTVHINDAQFFVGMPKNVWTYQVGGYQVCEKWLKDRKGRELTKEEIQTYCKMVTALSKTILIQKEIDELYNGVES